MLKIRDVTFALLIAGSGALITACGGGGGDTPQPYTIAEWTGDTFVTPRAIYSSGSETETLASGYRYYPYDNNDDFSGFIYQAGGNELWYRETDAGGVDGSYTYRNFNEEYRLVARDEDAFSTDSGMLAFAGYDFWEDGDTALDEAGLFALEGEYAAAIGWYSSNDGLRGTVGLATPTASLPNSGSAVWRGKALGGFVVGTPVDRTDLYSRVQRDSNGLRGGDGMRYFVEGDTTRIVDFATGSWDSYFVLRAYQEPTTDGRAYWNHLLGETGTATTEEDVVGTLFVEFEGDISSPGYYSLNDYDGLGVFAHLASEFVNGRAMRVSYNFGFYGPNLEETAGDVRLSACSLEPTYDSDDHFVSCGGDLHHLGVGFVEQEAELAELPLSTTPMPVQGDTLAEVLGKLNLADVEAEDEDFGSELTISEYDNFIASGLEELQIYSYEYASFGFWERLVMDETSGEIVSQDGHLYFGDNRVMDLPATGTATYNLAFILSDPDLFNSFSARNGSLTANFGTNAITGNFGIPASASHDDSITMVFTNGAIHNDATFSGDLTVSANPTGFFADVNTGANGNFEGAFYDSATYDASVAPAEVAGTLSGVMDSNDNEWTGGFIGNQNNN